MTIDIPKTDGRHFDLGAQNADFFVLTLSPGEVETGLVGNALDRLLSLSDSRAHFVKYKNKLTFIFEGFDKDPREVSQIPVCVKFFRELTRAWPYWFHFIEKGPTFGVMYRLLCDTQVITEHNGKKGFLFLNQEQIPLVTKQLFSAMQALYEMHCIDSERAKMAVAEVNSAFMAVFKPSRR